MNSQGSFICKCDTGYVKNGDQCDDLNECLLTSTNNCGYRSTCKNTIGSNKCPCDAGFAKDGDKCKDIDECAMDTDNCHEFRVHNVKICDLLF
jgi:hypothetical protein